MEIKLPSAVNLAKRSKERAELDAAVNARLLKETETQREWCRHYEWLISHGFLPEDKEYDRLVESDIIPAEYVAGKLLAAGRVKGYWEKQFSINPPENIDVAAKREELTRLVEDRNRKMAEHGWQKDYTGIFRTKPLYDTLVESSKLPDPVDLWKTMWFEGELCCLFADTNVGKSIYSIQIAEHIAESRKILVFDFELQDKQLEKRARDGNMNIYRFNPNLLRTRIYLGELEPEDALEDVIVDAIEQECTFRGVDTLIIDNIGWLTTNAADSEVADKLVKKLTSLRDRRGFSMLVIGHTNKRDLKQPITQNDLSGSKKLMNYFDAAFCIGCGVSDPSLRYVKQVKNRNGEFTYGEENVIVCEITSEGGWAHFEERSFCTESKMLRSESHNEEEALEKNIIHCYRTEKMTMASIARKLNISFSKVQRTIARHSPGG